MPKIIIQELSKISELHTKPFSNGLSWKIKSAIILTDCSNTFSKIQDLALQKCFKLNDFEELTSNELEQLHWNFMTFPNILYLKIYCKKHPAESLISSHFECKNGFISWKIRFLKKKLFSVN